MTPESGPTLDAPLAMPEVLILGDSHSIALKSGCDAQGIRADILSFSGNLWHMGHVSLHHIHGITVRSKVQFERIAALRQRLGGTTVTRPDLPIIASAGFYLGRLVAPFNSRGHVTDAEGFAADESSLFASRGLTEAYVRHWRTPHITFLKRLARRAPLTIVAPPPVYPWPNYPMVIDIITRMMRDAGLAVYDPRDDLATGGRTLSPDYLAQDQVHGNERYGTELIGHMLRRGLIVRHSPQ
jgi:hypothetical protein